MRHLHIDFAARGRRPWAIGWLVLALGVVGLGMASLDLIDAQNARDEASARAAQLAPPARTGTASRSAALPPAQARAIARAQAALDRPWGLLWRELELRRPSDIALLSVDASVSARENTVRLIGEAPEVARALRWVEALRAVPIVRSADLVQHERRDGDGLSLVRFTIELRWSGGQP